MGTHKETCSKTKCAWDSRVRRVLLRVISEPCVRFCPAHLPLEGWLRLTWPWYHGHTPVRLGVCPHSPDEVNRTNKYSTGSQAWELESLPHRRPPRRSLLAYQRCPLLGGQEPLQATRLPCQKGSQGCQEAAAQRVRTEQKGKEGRRGGQEANQRYDRDAENPRASGRISDPRGCPVRTPPPITAGK